MASRRDIADLRDAADTLLAAVEKTIDSRTDKSDLDTGAIQIAREYAAVIDRSYGHCRGCEDPTCQQVGTSAWSMRWIAPLLLECLAHLGATPLARARLKGGKPGDAPVSQLAKLREAHRA
jgi:hypothetical protein